MSPNEPEPILRTRRYFAPIKNSDFDDSCSDELAPDVKSIVVELCVFLSFCIDVTHDGNGNRGEEDLKGGEKKKGHERSTSDEMRLNRDESNRMTVRKILMHTV